MNVNTIFLMKMGIILFSVFGLTIWSMYKTRNDFVMVLVIGILILSAVLLSLGMQVSDLHKQNNIIISATDDELIEEAMSEDFVEFIDNE